MKHFKTNKNDDIECTHCGSTNCETEVIHDGHTNYHCKDCNVLETDHDPIKKDN